MNHYTIELQSRTKNFSISVIEMLRLLKIDIINKAIISQVIRSSTSIGANYNEALESESRDDFIHKLSICKKEASETRYWLDILSTTNSSVVNQINPLIKEVAELTKIFAATIATTKRNKLIKQNGLMV